MPDTTRSRPHPRSRPAGSAAHRRALPLTEIPPAAGAPGALTAGGTEGNARLTTWTGLILFVLLAALGLTIVRIGQLLWLHLFLGLLLLGPVALKMLSTGYRFMRYYTGNARYRRKGPPAPALRLLAPAVVGLTMIVFASGVALLLLGPSSRGSLLLLHKASFILWLGAMAIHVLGHMPEVMRTLRTAGDTRADMMAMRSAHRSRRASSARGGAARSAGAEALPGGAGRLLSIGSALVFGLVLAVLLIPQFAAWTHAFGGFRHFGH
jgi:hypothetical protein